MVICNGVFLVLVFGRWFYCVLMQVTSDDEFGGVELV
jgi:hypothetical protein